MSEFNIEYKRLAEMQKTEQALLRLEEHVLQDSVVQVHIDELRHPFIVMTDELADMFSAMPTRPNAISDIDLELDYDRQSARFSAVRAQLNMDNGFSLGFYKLSRMRTSNGSPLYYPAILNPDGRQATKQQSTPLVTEPTVVEILGHVGLDLPVREQKAAWEEIVGILQFAGQWKARADRVVPLTPFETAAIETQSEGNANVLESVDGLSRKMIAFSFEQSDRPYGNALECHKLVASTEFAHEPPTLQQAMIVPLRYQDATLETGFGEIPIDAPKVRIEQLGQAHILPFSVALLEHARAQMERVLQEPLRPERP